jgi:DNA segregation ATPase FtsK/SpoIIIE-like protein
VDPKRIEFSMYNNQKYMLCPAVTDMSMAARWLEKLCDEMNARYAVFEKAMVRNIGEYIEKGNKMPYIVCVIDEFADLILFDKNVEKQVQILAQKSRAAGIHLIIATQRPSVDVITGVIKANLPTRLSYKVSSPVDSMTILNTAGAEDLLGRGDSLLLEENGTLTRTLGAYTPNSDIMSLLLPYRCEMNDIDYSGIITGAQIQEQTQEYIAQQEKAKEDALNGAKPQGLFDKLKGWWNKLGKPMQRRVVNIGIAFVMALISSKSGKSKKSAIQNATDAAVKSAKRSVKAQAKQAITKTILDSLNKK